MTTKYGRTLSYVKRRSAISKVSKILAFADNMAYGVCVRIDIAPCKAGSVKPIAEWSVVDTCWAELGLEAAR
jgi:hypothetical protein